MWNAENGTLLFALEKSSSERVACLDPEGKRLVLFDNPIRIHDAENGKELIRFEGFDVWGENWKGRQLGLSPFSPDGKKLLVFGGAGLGLIDVETGKQLVTFRGHSGALKSALWSQDGRFVVTASDDMTARVWDAATGKEVHLLRHKASVAFATMTADDRRVVTASDTVRIWDLDPLPIAMHASPVSLFSLREGSLWHQIASRGSLLRGPRAGGIAFWTNPAAVFFLDAAVRPTDVVKTSVMQRRRDPPGNKAGCSSSGGRSSAGRMCRHLDVGGSSCLAY